MGEETEHAAVTLSCHGCGQRLDVGELEPLSELACPACGAGLVVPKPFGALLLTARVGQGAVGTVYRGLDTTLDREVAVEVLREEFAADTVLRALFLEQARAASGVSHPNVLGVYSCGELGGAPYLVMPWMAGGSLAQAMAQGGDRPLSVSMVCGWFAAVARGLEAAQVSGLCHGGMSPSCVLLSDEGVVRVGEFGFARVLEAGGLANLPFNRALYASPERVERGRDGTPGDIFSFGASLYHVLTRCPPFCGGTVAEVLQDRFASVPTVPAVLRPDVPKEVSELVMACLKVAPVERPQSYAQITRVLETAAGSGAPLSSDDVPTQRLPRKRKRGPGRLPLRADKPKIRASSRPAARVRKGGSRRLHPYGYRGGSSGARLAQILLVLIIIGLILFLVVQAGNAAEPAPPWAPALRLCAM